MDAKQRQQISEREINKTDFKGSLTYSESSIQPHFKAQTDLLTKQVSEIYNPDYESNGKSPVSALRDIPKHEMGHHGYQDLETKTRFYGCPRTVDNGRRLIYEPMFEVLSEQGGFIPEDVAYAENLLEDTLLQADLSRQHPLQGITDFFQDVANSNNKEFGNLYEAHVKLNLWLWGNKQQKRQLRKYFKHSTEVTEVLQNFLQRTGLKDLTQKLGDEDIKDKARLRDFLMDEIHWPEISRIYAEEFVKLMTPGYARPTLNHSGAGTSGKEDEQGSPEGEGNCFQQQADSEDYKRTRVQETETSGGELPNWMRDTKEHLIEARTLYYNNLARRLNIKAETQTHTMSMPLVYFGERPFDPLKDSFKRTRLKPNNQGQLEWKKNRFQIKTPIEIKESSRGFPPVRLGFLDCSTSMLSDLKGGSNIGNTNIVPWGDNSRYHYANLGWEGFLEYLRHNRLLNQNNVELYTIGEKTRQGIGLKQARHLALNPVFENDTLIDPKVVQDIFRGNGNLIFTISDGEIRNWEDIKEDVFDGAERNLYFHLQIGNDSDSAVEMRQRGMHATEPILNGEDIPRLTIDLTKQVRKSRQ